LFDRDFTEASRMLSDFQPKVDVSEDDKFAFSVKSLVCILCQPSNPN
jgi:hypothetical protein